jgi:hypothetical protein
MAQLNQAFIPEAVEDDGGSFDPIPAGVYEAQIIESRLDDTNGKNGPGKMLVLQVEVLGPKYVKRQIFDQLNIVNPSAQAQDIAAKTLKRICTAVGWSGPLADSSDLHFKPMRIRVAVDPNPGHTPKNVIKGYDAIGGAAPAQASAPRQATPAQQTVAAAPAEAKKKRPW